MTPTPAQDDYQEKKRRLLKLKGDISVLLLHYKAEQEGISFDDYCSIYDSERHEYTLNTILKIAL